MAVAQRARGSSPLQASFAGAVLPNLLALQVQQYYKSSNTDAKGAADARHPLAHGQLRPLAALVLSRPLDLEAAASFSAIAAEIGELTDVC